MCVYQINIIGCATTNRTKIVGMSIASGVAGVTYGSLQPGYKQQNSILFGSLAMAVAAVAGLYIFDEQKVSEKLRLEKADLEERISILDQQNRPHLIAEGSSLMAAPLPKDLSHLIQPGQWRRYKLDQWVQDIGNPNVWYRQQEMFEIVPPNPLLQK